MRGDLLGFSFLLGVLRLREKCGGNFGKIWWGCAREFGDRWGFPVDLMGIARGLHWGCVGNALALLRIAGGLFILA